MNLITNNSEARSKALEQVQQIIVANLDDSLSSIYLFGSWARVEEKKTSDIDVAIEFSSNESTNHTIVANIREALEESHIPYRVDVVYLNQADDYIITKVREEGILWDVRKND